MRIQTDLVLLGGGHSHALVLKMWGMHPLPGVRLTLISDRSYAPYSGMLPGYLAGFYTFEECHIDLRRLATFAGAQFYLDHGVGLDLQHQRVQCVHHPPVGFDWLSIDIGSTPQMSQVPGADRYTIPVKPVPAFLDIWDKTLKAIGAHPDYPWSFAIVGGGAGGVELALALEARIQRLGKETGTQPKVQFHLLHQGDHLMTGHCTSIQHCFEDHLHRRNIAVYLQESVTEIYPNSSEGIGPIPPLGHPFCLTTASGLHLESDRIFWTTQATAAPWIAVSELSTDDRGFIWVENTLQSCSHSSVFAAGDIASLKHHPRPKAGVFAVRHGKPLFENLQRVIQGQALRSFVPQRQLLALISNGQGQAAASRGFWGLPLSPLLWHWKDHIDRRFMAKFHILPPRSMPGSMSRAMAGSMIQRANPAMPMYCAGCGSKVGRNILDTTLQRLRGEGWLHRPEDIPLGLQGRDDGVVIQSRSGAWLVQTVDFFPSPVADPFLAGQLTTEHCLNDLYAMGADPHSALAIVTLPHGSGSVQAETLYQLLAGVVQRLQAVGAVLLGGHTTEGETIALGLSCNGWMSRSQPFWQKGRVSAGQVLILTKALGSGTLLVAETQGEAKAQWMDALVSEMLQSNHAAVGILRRFGASSCTDVTGFGLLGHALELVGSEDLTLGLTLDLATLPLLPGAVASLQRGHLSSLYPQNVKILERSELALHDRLQYWAGDDRLTTPTDHPHWPILFDPQTAGGLLAAVPSDQAADCLRSLHGAGYEQSAIVGQLLVTVRELK